MVAVFDPAFLFFCLIDKHIMDGPAGHAYRAFHNADIFFLCFNISFFISRSRIALFCGDKPGSHLDPVCSQRQRMLHILSIEDSSCYDHRNVPSCFFFVFFVFTDNRQGHLVIGFRGKSIQFFCGKSQMASCFRPFDHYEIRISFILSLPHSAQDCIGFQGRDHRSNLYIRTFCAFRQVHRKPCAGNDHIRTGFYSSFHIFFIALGSHHDIKAYDTAIGNLSGCRQFFFHSPVIGLKRVLIKIRLPPPDLGGRDNADAAVGRHTAGQTGKTDSHSHSSLYHRDLRL